MSDFEAYKTYLAVKRHFEPGSSYDYKKYNGKVSATMKSFEGRRDAFHFKRLAKHPDVLGFLVANLSDNPKGWIGGLVGSREAQRKYEERKKKLEAIEYTVSSEMSRLGDDFNALISVHEDGTHPTLLSEHLAGRVSIETMAIVDKLISVTSYWEKFISSDVIVAQVIERIRKASSFLECDLEAVRLAVMKKFPGNA